MLNRCRRSGFNGELHHWQGLMMINYTGDGSFALKMKLAVLLLATLLIGPGSVHAAEDLNPDKFKFTLGGYSIFRYDSKVALTDSNRGAGVFVDPQETLGLDSEQTVARLTGYYRINKTHSVNFSYYKISSDAKKVVETEFDWIDENGDPITIPIGAEVKSALDYEILKLGYLWSFHHTDKVELGVGAGLHVTRVDFSLQSDSTNLGSSAGDASVTAPLPVVSFALNYSVTPKFSWLFKTEIFGIKYGDVTGIYTDTTLSAEYRFVKNFGLGLGLGASSLEADQDGHDENFSYKNRISGLLLYATLHF
jgi:hypothetical protein